MDHLKCAQRHPPNADGHRPTPHHLAPNRAAVMTDLAASPTTTRLRLACDLARVTATALTDKTGLTGSAATHLDPPASAKRLTPKWLTGALKIGRAHV